MVCEYGCGNDAKYQLKNGKWCCQENWQACPKKRSENKERCKKFNSTENALKTVTRLEKIECRYCKKKCSKGNIKQHEKSCYLNLDNLKICPVCYNPIKNYKNNVTCSSKCARSYFADMYDEFGRNNGGKKRYQTICFQHHKKKCVYCGEEKIVAVHHNDGDHSNNDPINLIPLCPTHHTYMHSRYKDEIQPSIDEYLQNDFLKEKNKE